MKVDLIKELENFIQTKKVDLVTKRLLDLFWYYHRNHSLYVEVSKLRADYNRKRVLGRSEVDKSAFDEFLNTAKKYLDAIKNIKPENEDVANMGEVLVKVSNLQKKFKHASKGFSFGPVDLLINKGDITGIVGENGNGKTTFLRLLQEEISKDGGELDHFYNLEKIAASDSYRIKNRTAFIPQRVPRWRGSLMENLSFYAGIHGFKGKENEKIVSYVIDRMGLTSFAGLNWSQLSTGYKLRFELAKMLVWEPDILILDEPLANLDIQATQNLLEDLKFFTRSPIHPVGIILTSQQLHEVEQIADNILFLKNGSSIYSGKRDNFAETRKENCLEVEGKLWLEDLQRSLRDFDVKIEPNNTMFRITFDKSVEVNTILRSLIKDDLRIKYFRDITESTIQLFND